MNHRSPIAGVFLLALLFAVSARADRLLTYSQPVAANNVYSAYKASSYPDRLANGDAAVLSDDSGKGLRLAYSWGGNREVPAGITQALFSRYTNQQLSGEVQDYSNCSGISFRYRTTGAVRLSVSLLSAFAAEPYQGVGAPEGARDSVDFPASKEWTTANFIPWKDLDHFGRWNRERLGVTHLNFALRSLAASGSMDTLGTLEIDSVQIVGEVKSSMFFAQDTNGHSYGDASPIANFADANLSAVNVPKFSSRWSATADGGTTWLDTADDLSGSDLFPIKGGLYRSTPYDPGWISIAARLVRKANNAADGWAAISGVVTSKVADRCGNYMEGIGFDIAMGDSLGRNFDTTALGGVEFRAVRIRDSSIFYQAGIPWATNRRGHVVIWFDSTLFLDSIRLEWRLHLLERDAKGRAIDTAAFSVVSLSGLYAVNPPAMLGSSSSSPCQIPGLIASRPVRTDFLARYVHGLVLDYATSAQQASVDVLRLDGSRVASFPHLKPSASGMALPLTLSKGTYLVRLQAGKERFVSTMKVF